MIKLSFKTVCIGFGLLIFPMVAHGHASVVAKSDGVEIYKEASDKAAKIATLKKNDAVETMERKGLFWQVKTATGEVGFVSVMKVKRQSGAGDNSISQAIRSASEDGRSNGDEVENTRARSAVMGVRGLDESSETQYAGNAKPNLRLVYQMEDRQVSKRHIEKLETQLQKELESLSKGSHK